VSRHMVTLVDHHHTPEIRPAGKIPPAQGLHQADGEPLADAFLAPTNDADLFGTKAETGYSPITYLNKQVLFVRDPKYRLADPCQHLQRHLGLSGAGRGDQDALRCYKQLLHRWFLVVPELDPRRHRNFRMLHPSVVHL